MLRETETLGRGWRIYTHGGHKLRLFSLREAQFVTTGILVENNPDEGELYGQMIGEKHE